LLHQVFYDVVGQLVVGGTSLLAALATHDTSNQDFSDGTIFFTPSYQVSNNDLRQAPWGPLSAFRDVQQLIGCEIGDSLGASCTILQKLL